MRAASLFALAIVLAGCVQPVNPGSGPEYCDPAANARLSTSSPQPETIAAGNVTTVMARIDACDDAAFVVDRTPGGAGNCVFDFLVADLVQGNRTWDVQRDAAGAAMAPPPFPPPCPAVSDPNTTVAPGGNLSATFGWNGTLASTHCETDANGTRCDSGASFEPAPPGTYGLVLRARANGHDIEAWENVTVVRSGLHFLGADYNQTYASPLDVKSVRAALLDMGFTVETPCGRQDCDISRTRNSCADFLTCPAIDYGARLHNGSTTVDVWSPNDGTKDFGYDAAQAREAADAFCRDRASDATALLADLDARLHVTPATTMTCEAAIVTGP